MAGSNIPDIASDTEKGILKVKFPRTLYLYPMETTLMLLFSLSYDIVH